MNVKVANAMSGYIEQVYIVNQKLIKICGLDIMIDYQNDEQEILDIIKDIPRVIPYVFDRKTNVLNLELKDGLLEFCDEISNLESDYQKILHNNIVFLEKIRKISNKYKHKMHDISFLSAGTGTLHVFDYTFEIDQCAIHVSAGEFIHLFKQINILFSSIVDQIR